MKRIFWLGLLVSLITSPLQAQVHSGPLYGIVLDSATRKPLPNAEVWVGHTMLNTRTNRLGQFAFAQAPLGTLEVVAAMPGYRPTWVSRRHLQTAADQLDTILLKKGPPQLLNDVLARDAATQKQARHLNTFFKRFIGTSQNAEACQIMNPWVLKFTFEKQGKQAFYSATATDVLIVENRALGYQLRCFIEEFQIVDKTARFNGTVGFTPLAPKDSTEAKQWRMARNWAYRGSVAHFLHALVANQAFSEGYYIYPAKAETALFYRTHTPASNQLRADQLNQPTELEFERKLVFKDCDFIHVNYDGEAETLEVRRFARDMSGVVALNDDYQASWLHLKRREVTYNTAGWLYLTPDVELLGQWEFEMWADRVPVEFRPPVVAAPPRNDPPPPAAPNPKKKKIAKN
ncbi:MAG: carboxypeptidase-like regulatory domain-containing protein [Bernardetiaceae bacterium]|jgi:hypothetical protein|nr:carboxypeptidase-like regulatory domain-containing protein [Bernardetiaceae bacterium]